MARNSSFKDLALGRFQSVTGLTLMRKGPEARPTWLIATNSGEGSLELDVRRIASPSRYQIESAIVHHAVAGWMEEARSERERGKVLLVSVPYLNPDMIDRIPSLLNRIDLGLEAQWAIVSDAGGSELELSHFSLRRRIEDDPRNTGISGVKQGSPTNFEFSDATASVLKVLILHQLGRWSPWPGTEPTVRIKVPGHVARQAQVSIATVYGVLRQLAQAAFMEGRSRGSLLVDAPRSLLDLWIAHARLAPPPFTIPVRPRYPDIYATSREAQARAFLHRRWMLESALGVPPTWAINGWLAASCRGMSWVTDVDRQPFGVTCFVPPESLFESWQLLGCSDPRDALFNLEIPRLPRSVRIGVTSLRNADSMEGIDAGVPIVDEIQMALDVCRDSGRGMEQAEHICERLLSDPPRSP